ncbi:MAG: DUF1146 domain-containing protein [Firmicutes bacterium]|nr:DUF1146 domain-containing protein [Bacillota bacterium]
MSVKFFIYVFVACIVIWSLDAVNINQIFKKNKVMQARVFYFLLALALIQLVTTFIYDFYIASKII